MNSLPPAYDPRQIESESRAFWAARSLPPPEGPLGPSSGPLVRLVSGPVPREAPSLGTALRLARLDAEARWLSRTGRRVAGLLRPPLSDPVAPAEGSPDPLGSLGVWFGGGVLRAPGAQEAAIRRALLERLAADRILISRSVPVQVCPNCRRPNSPESVIYQEEEGSAYLVRFPIEGADPPVSLLVWTDAAWKLLGTTAVLVGPKLPYVVLRHTRRGVEERVLCGLGAVERLRGWLPDARIEQIEERTGSQLAGTRYRHPLALEHPSVANLPEPGGCVVASDDVEDAGTGILTLTPAHGVADAEVAHVLGIPGWPIVGTDGQLTHAVQHKYAGLSREDGEAFILRDLIDDGAIFAQLSVRRGVPRCGRCGSALLWTPARVWSLEPGRLPPDRLQLYRRVLPAAVMPEPGASIPWPVSEFVATGPEGTVGLAECAQCELLAPDTAAGPCSCGGVRSVVRRCLLSEFEEALAAWASVDSFPDGTAVRLIVPERRRGPTLLHHLAAMHASRRRPGELRLLALVTVPEVGPVKGGEEPIDALRAALLMTRQLSAGRATLEGHRQQMAARLRRVWHTAAELLERLRSAGEEVDLSSVIAHHSSLLEEDRAFLSMFERLRLDVQRAYEEDRFAEGIDRLFRFFEGELRRGYLRLVGPRLRLPGSPPVKLSSLRVLSYALPVWIGLLAPVAPFTAEALWRGFRGDDVSVFESASPPAQEGWIDAGLETSYAGWRSLYEAALRGRKSLELAPEERIPALAIVVADDEQGARLRAQLPILARLLNADAVVVGSPRQPWEGRHLEVRPRLAELQRSFGLRAPRIVRMLQNMPSRRIQEGLGAGSLNVVLDGNALTLTAAMFEFVEGLPTGVEPVPWAGGQLYLTLPVGRGDPRPSANPVLSLEAFRLLRSVERRLHGLPLDAPAAEVVVRVAGPLREELEKQAVPIARRLHVPRFRVDTPEDRFVPNETHFGTTGRGVAWSVWIPGAARPVQPAKARRRSLGHRRAPEAPTMAAVPENELEFLSDALRDRERAVNALLEELDGTLAGPLLGPTKLTGVWEHGFRTRSAIASAPFETIAALPGFGPALARELIRSVGGQAPGPVLRKYPPRHRNPGRPSEPAPPPTISSSPAVPALAPRPSPAPRPAALSAISTEPPVPPPEVLRIPVPPEPPVISFSDPATNPPAGTSSNPIDPPTEAPNVDGPEAGSPPEAPAPSAEPPLDSPSTADSPEPVREPIPEVGGPPPETEPEALDLDPEPPGLDAATEPEIPDDPVRGMPAELTPGSTFAPGPAPAAEYLSVEPTGEKPAAEEGLVPETIEPAPGSADPEPLGGPGPELSTPEVEAGHLPDEVPVPSDPNPQEAPIALEIGEAAPSDPDLGVPDPEPPTNSAPKTEEAVAVISPPEALTIVPIPATDSIVGPPGPPVPASDAPEMAPSSGSDPVPGTEEALPDPREAVPEALVAETAGPAVDPRPAPEEPPGPPGAAAARAPAPEPTVVAPIAAEAVEPESAVEPVAVPDGILLTEGASTRGAWDEFLEATSAGHRGLCLTREFPDRVRVYLRHRAVEIAWISSVPKPGALRPSDLAGITHRILTALNDQQVTAVLFEGVEYLVSLHSAERSLPALRQIDGAARAHRARVWIPINPELLPAPEWARLREGLVASPSADGDPASGADAP